VVERTLAWLNRNRRLAKDFENYPFTRRFESDSEQAWLSHEGLTGTADDAMMADR
jgi:hypothetical protein